MVALAAPPWKICVSMAMSYALRFAPERIQPGTGPSFFVGWASCGSGETCATAVQARRTAAAGIARYKTRMDELLIIGILNLFRKSATRLEVFEHGLPRVALTISRLGMICGLASPCR